MPALSQIRVTAGLAAGALALHELRYAAAYGESADEALALSGHEYLSTLTPLIAVFLACVLGHLIHRAASGREAHTGRVHGRAGAATAFAFALLAIFTTQELAEGLLASGHASGVHGAFGHGGWVAAPLSLVFGTLLAFSSKGLRHALEVVDRARRIRRPALISATPFDVHVTRPVRPAAAPLARHGANRAPPFAVA